MNDDVNDTGAPAEGGGDQPATQTLEQVYETHKIDDDAQKYAATETRPIPPVNAPQRDETGFLSDLTHSHNNLAQQLNAITHQNAQQAIRKDIDSAVALVSEGLGIDADVVENHIDLRAKKDPRLQSIWDNRQKNPKALQDALRAIKAELADKYQVRPDPNLYANHQAMRAFQGGSAARASPNNPGENLNKADFARFWAGDH